MKSQQPLTLTGDITPFKGDGRKLGYPTANLTTVTTAADGVYFGFADLQDWLHHPAIVFVGTPTTMGHTERRVEAHLLDIPDEDYYGQVLTLTLDHYHRGNQTFVDVDELLAVMRDDEAKARQWFAGNNG